MPTEKQLAANRRNARHSTGPCSPAGKANSALNALKTGIYAESLILPQENPEHLRTLIEEYYLFYAPITPSARNSLDTMIRAEWTNRRLARIDTQILTHEINTLWKPESGCTAGQAYQHCRSDMHKIQLRITATDNLYHRNLKVLQLLQPEAPIQAQPEAEPAAPGPEPEPSSPAFPTAQPAEIKTETPQLASFPKTTPTPPPDGHPAEIHDCPNCRNLGYRNPNCRYVLRRAS